jgi:hypothetical protein
MSLRPLPGFLLHGDPYLGFPPPEPAIGHSPPGLTTHDPASADEIAAREWLAHVHAGRIGGGTVQEE